MALAALKIVLSPVMAKLLFVDTFKITLLNCISRNRRYIVFGRNICVEYLAPHMSIPVYRIGAMSLKIPACSYIEISGTDSRIQSIVLVITSTLNGLLGVHDGPSRPSDTITTRHQCFWTRLNAFRKQ